MIGVELEIEGSKIADSCMQEGLLLNCTAYKVLRFVPPLTINKKRNRPRPGHPGKSSRPPINRLVRIPVMSKRDLLNFDWSEPPRVRRDFSTGRKISNASRSGHRASPAGGKRAGHGF